MFYVQMIHFVLLHIVCILLLFGTSQFICIPLVASVENMTVK